jgi:hypothetical protein
VVRRQHADFAQLAHFLHKSQQAGRLDAVVIGTQNVHDNPYLQSQAGPALWFIYFKANSLLV